MKQCTDTLNLHSSLLYVRVPKYRPRGMHVLSHTDTFKCVLRFQKGYSGNQIRHSNHYVGYATGTDIHFKREQSSGNSVITTMVKEL
jgi:hypothetical protein